MPSLDDESSFTSLPSEIVHHILTYLPARDLFSISLANHRFREQTDNENLWKGLTWRELYLAYYPYWFLTRHKIWVADTPHTGKIIFIRYDPRRGCIEGYQLVALPGNLDYNPWVWNSDVIIHTTYPQVRLHLDNPEIKLNYFDQNRAWPRNWLEGDLPMVTGQQLNKIFSDLVLAKEISEQNINQKMVLWPPKNLPSTHHVRASSRDNFRSLGHKPQYIDDISQHTFRLRKRAQFITHLPAHNLISSEETSTFSTIDPVLYTPTAEKPWQGIWVGDYGGHGCEFVLLMQPDTSTAEHSSPKPNENNYPFTSNSRYIEDEESLRIALANSKSGEPPPPDKEGIYHGRLEAMKLTGDPNIPRGEYTFVADDIGPAGFVRILNEEPFKGARIVQSRGHVAAQDFEDDEFIPSQLILISNDKLAQYWVPFGHISFYERVHVDKLFGI